MLDLPEAGPDGPGQVADAGGRDVADSPFDQSPDTLLPGSGRVRKAGTALISLTFTDPRPVVEDTRI
ncbi:hypothetical protein [Kitasatospora sp. NPDC087314]|uniref:hypothetical protein n=1 Tax=Kitasatospora sp. NPDC087314 TaxID=3364068 RepID=UPI0038245966